MYAILNIATYRQFTNAAWDWIIKNKNKNKNKKKKSKKKNGFKTNSKKNKLHVQHTFTSN